MGIRKDNLDMSVQDTLRLTALMLREGHYSVGERLAPMYLEEAADLIDSLALRIILLQDQLVQHED